MKNRLEVARQLLKDDGLICISIDHNESAYLEVLCDEIFGRDNKLGVISVLHNWSGRSDDKYFATANEFLLVYAKNIKLAQISGFPLEENELARYKEEDDISIFEPRDFRKTGTGWRRADRPKMFYPILVKDEVISLPPKNEIENFFHKELNTEFVNRFKADYESKGYIVVLPQNKEGVFGRWRWNYDACQLKINQQFKYERKEGIDKIFEKARPVIEDLARTKTPKTIWYKPEYNTGSASKRLSNLFDTQETIFENPKSEFFIKDLLTITTNKDDLVLDFFAGSGTTGHAILELNAEDNGNRQFILVEQLQQYIEICQQRLVKVIARDNLNTSFISLELKKYNQLFKEQIRLAKTQTEILNIWGQMKAKAFFDYSVDLQKQEGKIQAGNQSLKQQKDGLEACLDKNQLYVNQSSLHDKDFACSDAEKKLTQDFYQISD